jgi:alcohol dehydrogenase class IV
MDARHAVRLIAGNLRRLIVDGPSDETRGAMALASLLAGRAFSNAGLGVVHAMAHALGGLLDSPHGLCNALLLDAGIEENFEAASGRYADLAIDMGAGVDDIARYGAKACVLRSVRELRAAVGISPGIREMGVKREDLARLAELASRDACLATNPVRLNAQNIAAIYDRAF